jgi:hypothetical protein
VANPANRKVIDRIGATVLARTCPLSCGQPTVFYGEEAFARACQDK